MWNKIECSFWWKKSKSTNRWKIASIKWMLFFNLIEVSLWSSRIISQIFNLMNRPWEMKHVIWDICMSEKQHLQIRNRAFSFLFERAIRQDKWQEFLTWLFFEILQSHEISWENFITIEDKIFYHEIIWRDDFIKISSSEILKRWEFSPDVLMKKMIIKFFGLFYMSKMSKMSFLLCVISEIWPPPELPWWWIFIPSHIWNMGEIIFFRRWTRWMKKQLRELNNAIWFLTELKGNCNI